MYVSLRSARHWRSTDVGVGAQNVHAETAGAFTGEVSAQMLVGLASWAIVGHSERRRDQGEDDELIGRKLVRCVEFGLRPILCVGEQLAEREAGQAESTVRGQLERTIAEVRRLGQELPSDLVIAYEPVWAIGTGRTARGSDAAAIAQLIRAVVRRDTDRAGTPTTCPCSTAAASPARRSRSSWPSPISMVRWSAAPA